MSIWDPEKARQAQELVQNALARTGSLMGTPGGFSQDPAVQSWALSQYREQQQQIPTAPVPTSIPGQAPAPAEPEPAWRQILHLVGAALDVGNRFVTRPALGFLFKQFSSNPEVQQASSYTEAYRKELEGHPWLQLGAEIALDPLNLVGVGAIGKLGKIPMVAKALEASPALAKAFTAAEAADEVAGRVLALPATGALAGLRAAGKGLEKVTGKPLFQKTAQALLRDERERILEAMRQFPDFMRWTADATPGDIADTAKEAIAQRLLQAPAEEQRQIITQLDAAPLIQAWDALSRRGDDPAARTALSRVNLELRRRGLLTVKDGELAPSERMLAHLALEDTLATRQFPEPARQAMHNILDAFAAATYTAEPGRFASLEDVYRQIRDIRPTSATNPDQLQTLAQRLDDVVKKAKENPSFIPQLDDELYQDAVAFLRSGLKEAPATDPADLALARLTRAGEVFQRERGAAAWEKARHWYRDAGAAFSALFPKEPLPEETIRRLVSPDNIDGNYQRPLLLTNQENDLLNQALKQVMAERGIAADKVPTRGIPEDLVREALSRIDPEAWARAGSSGALERIKYVKPAEPVNPLLDTARYLGLTKVENLDPETIARLGIDTSRVDSEGFLLPEEASKVVADILRGKTVRDVALAAWAAGGKDASPVQNTQAVLRWTAQVLEGNHPGGVLKSGYEEFRRGLLLGDVGIFPESAQQRVAQFAPNPFARWTQMTSLPQETGAILSFPDKLFNYTQVVRRYADLVDEAKARLAAGEPEEAVRGWFQEQARQVAAAAHDRWQREEYYKAVGWPVEEAAKQAEKSLDERRALAERALFQRIWEKVQADPVLRDLYPTKDSLQAAMWQGSKLEGESLNPRGPWRLGPVFQRLMEGDSEGFRQIVQSWDFNLISDIIGSKAATQLKEYLESLAARGIQAPEDAKELVNRIWPILKQGLEEARGYVRLGPEGLAIRLTPTADITTLPHELAHVYRYLTRGPGVFAEAARAGEEGFASGIERLLATGEFPQEMARILDPYRRFAEVAYRGLVPQEQLTPEVARDLIQRLSQPAAEAAPAPEILPLAEGTAKSARAPGTRVTQQEAATTTDPIPLGEPAHDTTVAEEAAAPAHATVEQATQEAKTAPETPLVLRERPQIPEKQLFNEVVLQARDSGALRYTDGDPNPVVGGRPLFHDSGRGPLDFNPQRKIALLQKAGAWLYQNHTWDLNQVRELLRDPTGRGLSQRELAHLEWMLQKMGWLDPAQAELTRGAFPGSVLQQAPAETAAGAQAAQALTSEVPGPTMRPLSRASLEDVLSQVAAEERLPQDRVQQALQYLDKLSVSPVSLWLPSLRRHVVDLLQNPTPEAAARLYREAGDTWAAFGTLFPRAEALLRRVLPARGSRPEDITSVLGRSWFGSSRSDDAAATLQQVMQRPEVQKAVASFQASQDKALEAYQQIVSRHPGLPEKPEDLTLRDLWEARKVATPEEAQAIDQLLSEAGLDPSKIQEAGSQVPQATLAQARQQRILESYLEARARELGVGRDPGVVKALSRLANALPLKAWREQALLTPRYHLQNILDNSVKAALFGVNPIKARSAFTLAERLGIHPPASVLWRPQETVWDEFVSPTGQTALGQILPGKVGEAAGRLVSFNRQVAQAVESSFRSAAWITETIRALKEAQPRFLELVQQELGEGARKHLEDFFAATPEGVAASADAVRKELVSVGVNPTDAASVASAWGRLVDEASQRGEQLVKRVYFDYGDERNIERWLGVRAWAPFHFWATRNIPFYLETLGQHPWLLRAWESYHRLSEEEQQRLGLTSRFTGTLPSVRTGILGYLFGPGTFFVNPLAAVSIADQLKYRYIPEDAPMLAKLQEQLSRIGLGLAPWFELPLGLTGALGQDWEMPRLLRHSNLLAQLTGIDVEAPLRRGVEKLQGKEAPVSTVSVAGIPVRGSSYEDALTNRRILELSLEETGRAAHPDYVAALDDPSNPIWQRANAEVRRQLLGQEILGMTLPLPVKALRDTEAVIRSARAQLPQDLPRGAMSRLAQAGWPGAAYTPLGWDIAGMRQEQMLQDLATQYFMLPPEQRMAFLAQNPLLADYLSWAQRQPRGMKEAWRYVQARGQTK